MQISWPNLKKCSMVSGRSALGLAFLFFSFEASLLAATPPTLRTKLVRDLEARRGTQFEKLVQNWQKNHGTQVVAPLLSIASDKTFKDADRYIALMAAAKIGGRATSAPISEYLKDKSWMIRCGALRALRGLRDTPTANLILPLLKDRAMVVRSEAVAAVRDLQPQGASSALAEALSLPENFHAGRALWVPFEAAGALIEMAKAELRAPGAKDISLPASWRVVAKTFITTIEKHKNDARLAERLAAGLDLIIGKAPSAAATLPERLSYWKKSLAQ